MRYCPILFCFPLREDDFVDKEEDQHQNVTVEHRGSDVIDKVRHQQARNRRSHAVDEVNEAGDQTECQHQAICLARSTLPRNTKLRWMGNLNDKYIGRKAHGSCIFYHRICCLHHRHAAPIKANSGSNAAPGVFLMSTFQSDYWDCAADTFCW